MLSKETIERIEREAYDKCPEAPIEYDNPESYAFEAGWRACYISEATRYEQERKELRETLGEIEKSLYIGDDLNDKEILHFYVEVVKTIKKEIHKALNNNQ